MKLPCLRVHMFRVVALALAMVLPSAAWAGVGPPPSAWVNIGDLTNQLTGSVNDGSFSAPTNPITIAPGSIIGGVTVRNESPGVLGNMVIQLQYTEQAPLDVGQGRLLHFNIFEPGIVAQVSDTLSITFIGINPANFGGNTLVVLSFLSDSSDELLHPTALTGGDLLANVTETGAAQDLSELIHGAGAFTNNFHLQFASDVEVVPAPATLALLAIGLAGLGFSRRRKQV